MFKIYYFFKMKKLLPIFLFVSLFLLFPKHIYAGSEECFPSVWCPTGYDYYAEDCRTHIASCPAGQTYSCDKAAYCFTPGVGTPSSECSATNQCLRRDSTGAEICGNVDDGDWLILGTDMTSIPTGNVGIGAAPNAKLTVYGNGNLGAFNNPSGITAYGLGSLNTASGNYSVAIGIGSTASGNESLAAGWYSKATADNSISLGSLSVASGPTSVALGDRNTASGANSLATGMFTKAQKMQSTAMGYRMISNGDFSFGIGLGGGPYTIDNANTMAVMGGKVGIGITNPGETLTVDGGSSVSSLGIYNRTNGPWGLLLQNRDTGIGGLGIYQSTDGDAWLWHNYPSSYIQMTTSLVNIGPQLRVNGGLTMNDSTITGNGRLHIAGSELLYLLNTSGVIVSKAWGGNGNLTVEGKVGIGKAPGYQTLEVQGTILAYGDISSSTRLCIGDCGTGNSGVGIYNGKILAKGIYPSDAILTAWNNASTNPIAADFKGDIKITGNKHGSCTYLDKISEEGAPWAHCPEGMYVTGMQCTGSYCDNIQIECCEL